MDGGIPRSRARREPQSAPSNILTATTGGNPPPGVSEWVDDGTLTGGLPAAGRAYRIGLQ
jgi:hypothetical protein